VGGVARVYVYTYEATSYPSANYHGEKEGAREFEVRDERAVHVPTVVVSYRFEFIEGEMWSQKRLKLVVVDEDGENAKKLFEELVATIKEAPTDVDAIISTVHEVYEPDLYSYEKTVHERDGISRDVLIYLLQP
jgi:hypothetical protein